MTDNEPAKGVGIIKHHGQPMKAEFMGEIIEREENLFVEGWGIFVDCAPYDDHFVFEVPRVKIGRAKEFLASLRSTKAVTPETKQYITMLLGAIKAVDENQKVQLPSPMHMCTCGSAAAGIDTVNPTNQFSPNSPHAMLVCQLQFTSGSHQTSYVNKKDFDRIAAQGMPITPKGSKWLI